MLGRELGAARAIELLRKIAAGWSVSLNGSHERIAAFESGRREV